VSKRALDDRTGLQALLEILASMAAERGAYRRAAMLLGSAEGVRQSSAIQFHEGFRQRHKRSIDLVLAGWGQRQFDAVYEQGLTMSTDGAIAFAMSDKLPSRPVGVEARTKAPLTRRELEIANLIAQEMSSRDIAAKLFLSERTVETHITNMFNKLGLNSRVQLTRWLEVY
jgi:DNA-binding CsgD family transcriptional regulator